MGWTSEQQKVIDARNCDILVSAAAGSGKTSVLVERIIKKVTDEKAPVDIDHILVVTFTRAAAKEMRERIYRRLSEMQQEDPSNHRLLKQMTLVYQAQITTIDGFCQYVVRNHFLRINLDPQTKIADQTQVQLLAHEVVEELLEDYYGKGDKAFLLFADTYSVREKDRQLEKMILMLHEKAMSHPWPGEWLEELLAAYAIKDEDECMQSAWVQALAKEAKDEFAGLLLEGKKLLDEVEGHPYEDAVQNDCDLLERLNRAPDYESMRAILYEHKFATLSRKSVPEEDKDRRELLKSKRNRIKERIEKNKKELLFASKEELFAQMKANEPHMRMLAKLVKEFESRFAEKKREKGIMDFGDLEHFALNILVDEKTKEPTDAALRFRAYYNEIMVDEYQDTNFLQEMILSVIAKDKAGAHNYFMVGDVKQSIYRFRQARPDIFIEKYKAFVSGQHPSEHTRIDLDRNFRSRREVTNSVNDVFEVLMQEDCGGVIYDEAASLKCGALDYPKPEDEKAFVTELLVADSNDAYDEEMENDSILEATMIALRIKRLMREGRVTDKKTGKLRPVRYSDIALLHRSANKCGFMFVDTFAAYDIPAHMVSADGYFASTEVQTLLNVLRIINNPRNDIPLVGVLMSPMFAFTKDELVWIRTEEKGYFYKAFFTYAKSDKAGDKAKRFVASLEKWRKMAKDVSIAGLMEAILKETGYLSFVTAMPGGEGRRANLLKLIDLAIGFEKTSFVGLMSFVRYIEQMKKYEQDFGVADTVSENDDAIAVMTIHKSKGLEYPIVIVAGMGKKFVSPRQQLSIYDGYGIATDVIDVRARTSETSLFRKFLNRVEDKEQRGEDLRLLYVAMTRAKEKLILSGVCADFEDAYAALEETDSPLALSKKLSAQNFLSLMLPAIKANGNDFSISVYKNEQLIGEEMADIGERTDIKENILTAIDGADDASVAKLKEALSFSYSHPVGNYKTKYAVSELKHKAIDEMYSGKSEVEIFEDPEKEACIPLFISGEKKENRGAAHGTAMHRFLECFDFTLLDYAAAFAKEKERIQKTGRMDADQLALVSEGQINRFLKSPLAARMHKAAVEEKLQIEKAFVCGGKPGEFFDDAKEEADDFILVQGIIDVFFEEDDGIVLLDYKTDHVSSPNELIERYRKQLMLYKDAIERTNELKVKQILIYSFAFGEIVL